MTKFNSFYFSYFFFCSPEEIFSLLLEGGKEGRKEGNREREKHWCERETLIGCLSYVPQLGIESTTWVWALTRNQTCELSSIGWCYKQQSHSSQGKSQSFLDDTMSTWTLVLTVREKLKTEVPSLNSLKIVLLWTEQNNG